jgi:hypothetical protein
VLQLLISQQLLSQRGLALPCTQPAPVEVKRIIYHSANLQQQQGAGGESRQIQDCLVLNG